MSPFATQPKILAPKHQAPDLAQPIINTRKLKHYLTTNMCRTKRRYLLHFVSKTGLTIKCRTTSCMAIDMLTLLVTPLHKKSH